MLVTTRFCPKHFKGENHQPAEVLGMV